MNKNEKLLAARQKLKEFQLNKQYQENFHTHQCEDDDDRKAQELKININDSNRLVKKNEQFIDNHKASSDFLEISNLKKLESGKCVEEECMKRNSLDLSDINKKSEMSSIAISTFKSLPSIDRLSHDNKCLPSLLQDNVIIFEDKTLPCNDIPQNSFSSLNQCDLAPKHTSDVLLDNNITTNSPDINPEGDNQVSSDQLILRDLHSQFNQSQNNISDIENLALTQNIELNSKLIEEMNCLKKQIIMYLQTTNILITEKANLNKSLSHYQSSMKKKTQTIDELNHEFIFSQYQCNELQRTLLQMKRIVCEMEESYKLLQFNHKNFNHKCLELEKCNEEQKLEIAELQQSLNLKNIDLTTLHHEVQENNKLLVLSELKIQQLTNKSQKTYLLDDQNQIHRMFEEQSSKLHEHLKTFDAEKSEIFNHYENYVKQLINKCEVMSKDLQQSQFIIKNLEEREVNLEKQYQQEKQKVQSFFSQETNASQVEYFTKKINSSLQIQESLRNTLRDKEMEIEVLKKEVSELGELKNQSIEVSKLASALESEQLGASRAISQNHKLKEQLSEMQNEFITLSDTKLSLTQQLENELKVKEKLNIRLNSLVSKNEQLQHELDEKMAIIDKMEIEKFQTVSEVHQENYQTPSYQLIDLSKKCQNTLDLINIGEITNQESNFANESTADKDLHIRNNQVMKKDNNQLLVIEKVTGRFEESNKTHIHMQDFMTESTKKLETRFNEMMEKIAELTDEKQRLEHLVLQLQGETETIGEYITLYHKQRSILKRKAQDTEGTFRHLFEQYNQQHAQLYQLKVLLTDLLKDNDAFSSLHRENMESSNLYHKNEPDVVIEKLKIEQLGQLVFNKKSETTEKIINLIKHIIDCQDPCTVEQNFHPCLWCSGKLITV